ncbi:MAG: lysine--tRNA ligase [Abditibacteriota bacterium]|nr:lysine--tRNA ligase [Abditibacteriota bacterium]
MDEQKIISEDELIKTRIEKLEKLRELCGDPFAVERYEREAELEGKKIEATSAGVKKAFEENESDDENAPKIKASLAGRVVSIRVMGKAAFAHIMDLRGKIQIYFKRDDLGEMYKAVKLLDMGDFIGVKGFVFRTRMGEISLHAEELTVLSKSLRPIPFGKETEDKKWYGLQDVELRYRQRCIDLVTNADSRDTFIKRSKIISAIRKFYDSRGYIEVETPMLQAVAGGAAARPFITHHNALDHDYYLRISLELYLKRLIVGGLEKVYEIGRVFRNEGLDTRHNPEFTLMESYEAYADLDDIMNLVEDMFRYVCNELYGKTSFEYQGETIELGKPWRRLPMLEGIREYAGVEPEEFATLESSLKALERLGIDTEGETMIGGIIEKIHERYVQPKLIQPTFITDFPTENSPLAKKRQDNPNLTRRFEVYIAKQETGNAFSELNDPIDQKQRFEAQCAMRAAGDDEAHPMDTDYIRAMEYGMPPTGGLGIGIDRMAMILCDETALRDVLLFPTMKPLD